MNPFDLNQETAQQTVFSLPKGKKRKHKEGYYQNYYQNNRQNLLAYSHDYYQVKKLVEPYLKEEKKSRKEYQKQYQKNPKRKEYKKQWISAKRAEEKKANLGVKKLSTNFLSHTSIKEHSQRKKELFFVVDNTTEKKMGLMRRLDQKYLRMPTKNKIPQKKGWNMPWFEEWLNIAGLKKKYGEYGLLGGKKLGDKFLSFLDLDIRKEGFEEWRIKQLEKNVELLLNYLGCFHVKTKKGFHVYLLTEELLPNEMIYHVDSWLKKEQIIGSIQSKGKYVVGFDSVDKKLIEKGKWFWHVKDLEQIKSTLARFFLMVGKNQELAVKKTTEIYIEKIQQQLRDNVKKTPLSSVKSSPLLPVKKTLFQAKILSKQKTPLIDLWKVFYLDGKTQQNGYFLVNDYQKERTFGDLNVGSVRSVWLVQGTKHRFFNEIQSNTIQHKI